MKEILLNVESKEIRYALLKYGKLQDLIVERTTSKQITGNIYRGKVTNILHNIQSAFIDIGESDSGFVHINDILENIKKFETMFDMDFERKSDNKTETKKEIEKLFKKDQPVLVQVVKESIGGKGARLTSNLSIAGRYIVLLPNTPHRGVSRKIENKSLRDKLKKWLRAFDIPKEIGLICRTASSSATKEQLLKEVTDLLERWKTIVKKFESTEKPTCLYEESDIIKKAVLTAIDKKLDRILIDDRTTYLYAKDLNKAFANEYPLKIEYFDKKSLIFEKYNIEKEIDKALRRKIWLNCGGYLFFDKTEAMFTVDVNSGRSLKSKAYNNLDDALLKINLEAAEEIARQFRLRNIGGLIICDFIDMKLRKNQKKLLDKLKESMKEDRAKCTILGISEFGLIEMTRQRKRRSLSQIMFSYCPYCKGNGVIKSNETLFVEISRTLRKILFNYKKMNLKLTIHPELFKNITNEDKNKLQTMAKKEKCTLDFVKKDTIHMNDFVFSINNKEVEM